MFNTWIGLIVGYTFGIYSVPLEPRWLDALGYATVTGVCCLAGSFIRNGFQYDR